ncbi:MAG: hypothetical protein ORN51_06895 [Akkermansiaceae bacterium]|nr:hypothetical protein [Akkermansiaceae bacterium]
MSGILKILIIYLVLVPLAVAVELRLTEKGNFREIFDSGLRPKMLSGRSNKSCSVKNVSISLKIGGRVFPEFVASRLDIDVLNNHLMDEVIIFVDQKMSSKEARELAIRWGVHEDTLDNMNFENFGWELVPKNNNWRANAGFVSSYNEEKPLLFRLFISWKRPFKEMEMHQGLLPPPPGYEHVSMEEETGNPQEASNPNALPKNSIVPNRPEKIRPKTSDNLINARLKKLDHFPWWLIPSSIVLLVMALVAWLKVRKSKSTP